MSCRNLLLICALSTGLLAAAASSRKLHQSNGPAKTYGNAASATSADLVNDPAGRAHLLARLGNPVEYTGSYPLYVTAGQYNVDPSVNPTPVANGPPASEAGSWDVVGNSGAVALQALPFTNDQVLFIARPLNQNGGGDASLTNMLTVDNGTQSETAALYNMSSNTFTPFHITEEAEAAGHILLPDGRGLIVGGNNINLNGAFLTAGAQAIRIVDPTNKTSTLVSSLDRTRVGVTLATLGNGNILIMGGNQQEVGAFAADPSPTTTTHTPPTCSPNLGGSVADPDYDNPSFSILNPSDLSQSPSLTLALLLEAWPVNSYPYVVQLPSGSVFVAAGAIMGALFFTPDNATNDDSIGDLPNLPVPISYPQYGGFTLLPLEGPDYTTRVLFAGGAGEFCSGSNTSASQSSYLVNLTPGASHDLVTETMAFPRVMGDLTLLPDGTAFLCNGAQIGIAGGAGPNHSLADSGTTVGEIYNVSKPEGQRWSTVADSQIQRLYHSVAFLTSNADVLVAGSETTGEHRVQIWTPGYLQNGQPRPTITSAPSTITYGQNITVQYSGVSIIDRVVLVRVVGATDSNHMDQREVVLTGASSAGSVLVDTPPNSNVAPPGQYYLFVLSNGVPSKAAYVSLQLSLSSSTGPITS
uniref:Putative extracellular protein TR9_036 n=1 Tax=Trebouxia lynnae TaxID=1825957 RepID=A0A7L9QES7_9CHLO|nr:putative extracellular protein TR9_036 [Trebouxia lynnae]